MRQLLIQVARGYHKDVLEIAQARDGADTAQFEAIGHEKQ